MILEEAVLIGNIIRELPMLKNVLNVGSSSIEARKIGQPYIDKYIFRLLRDNNIKTAHLDMKEMNGVDIVADISNNNFSIQEKYDLVICTSLLEHVSNISTTVSNISSCVNKNGYLIINVPYIYPYHPYPIDNLFRPHPDELRSMFIDKKCICKKIIIEQKNIFYRMKRDLISLVKIILNKHFEAILYNIKCFLRKTSVSCVVFHSR